MMAISPAGLESEVHRIGQELARQSAGHVPTVFNARWWSGTLLDWCMKDEHFKVQLFRFIDVLPSLRNDPLVARLVDEYFGGAEAPASPLHWGLRAISGTRIGAYFSAKSLRHQIHQMAYTFIAGASVEEGIPALGRLWNQGRGFSIDLLGEATVSEREADQYRDRCLDALRLLGDAVATWTASPRLERDHLGLVPRVNLSVKLSALYSQFDPMDPEGTYRVVAGRLRPILDLALSLPAAVTFDMEQAETKDLTLTIFKRFFSEDAYAAYPYAGIALQAYLKDSSRDLEALTEWASRRAVPVTVRLVKGAYWDADTIRYQERHWPVPVFETKAETDANYEALSHALVQHPDLIKPVFGTHNLRSLAHAEALVQASQLPMETVEFQMIYGMAEPLQAAVAERGRRVRIYTPIGEILPGMAYLVRRLLENTSNESFLRQEYVESRPLGVLLAPPPPIPAQEQVLGPTDAVSAPLGGTRHSEEFVNEPHTDFSLSASREAMRQALVRVRGQLGATHSFPVPRGGSPSGEHLVSVNPSAPAEVVGRVRSLTPDQVDLLAEGVREGFASWSATPPERRADILVRAAAIMRKERFDLAAWEVFETGKAWREADGDVAEAIDFLEFYAKHMRNLGQPHRLGYEPGEMNHLIYMPRGVVAVIAPWNFPLAIPAGMVSAALVTGNVVLFKPSERSPVIASHLVRVLAEAGLPDGVLQMVPGGPDVGHALVGHPLVHVIAFTGSKEVGLEILARSAQVVPGQRFVKRVIAEMGGKNAIIVDDTADLDEAVTGVVTSFTGYQGQKCSACSRVVVEEGVYDTFLRRLSDAVKSLRIGPPEDPGNRVGPMIDERAQAKVREYAEIGKREGRLVLEREASGPGFFPGLTVIADITPEQRLAQEEVFGPVLAVMRAKDFDDALRIANATSYALTGGVYSRSPTNIAAARTAFEVGNLYINRPITGSLVGRQPFGGHRLSGAGAKTGGKDYLVQFMIARVISENTLRRGFAPLE